MYNSVISISLNRNLRKILDYYDSLSTDSDPRLHLLGTVSLRSVYSSSHSTMSYDSYSNRPSSSSSALSASDVSSSMKRKRCHKCSSTTSSCSCSCFLLFASAISFAIRTFPSALCIIQHQCARFFSLIASSRVLT